MMHMMASKSEFVILLRAQQQTCRIPHFSHNQCLWVLSFFHQLETLVLCQFIQKLGTRGYKKIKELPNNTVITIGEPVYVLWNLVISFQDFRGFSPRKEGEGHHQNKKERNCLDCEKLEKLVRNNWVPSQLLWFDFQYLGGLHASLILKEPKKVKENFRAHRLGLHVYKLQKPNSKEPIVQR